MAASSADRREARSSYLTDLTDAEWHQLAPYLPDEREAAELVRRTHRLATRDRTAQQRQLYVRGHSEALGSGAKYCLDLSEPASRQGLRAEGAN